MNWVEHAIWWHVYPLGFVGAPIREPEQGIHHRLPRLTNWLDYAVELGTSGLLLNPIFASDSHGYDINNYFEIDPRLGDQTDLDVFLAECKSRGLRVLFDGVFSHASKHFDHPELFDLQPDGTPNVFEGHENLLRLNHSNLATVDFVVKVMTHWLGRGIDGWRLDAGPIGSVAASMAGDSTPPTPSLPTSGHRLSPGSKSNTPTPGSWAKSSTATTTDSSNNRK